MRWVPDWALVKNLHREQDRRDTPGDRFADEALRIDPAREASRYARPAGTREALADLIGPPTTVEIVMEIEPTHLRFGRWILPDLAVERVDERRDSVFCEGACCGARCRRWSWRAGTTRSRWGHTGRG